MDHIYIYKNSWGAIYGRAHANEMLEQNAKTAEKSSIWMSINVIEKLKKTAQKVFRFLIKMYMHS